MYSADFPNYVFVVERNLKSSSFYEFLPQATLCILVRVDNLLWHFLKKVKTFSSFSDGKAWMLKGTYVMSETLTSGRKCKKLFVIWTLFPSPVTCWQYLNIQLVETSFDISVLWIDCEEQANWIRTSASHCKNLKNWLKEPRTLKS